MGNIFGCNKFRSNIYDPLIDNDNLGEHLRNILEKINKLEDDIKFIKRELDENTSRTETLIYVKCSDFANKISTNLQYYNDKNNGQLNEKINIITKDLENLLNNDKILLDKLIEKNIMSTIQ